MSPYRPLHDGWTVKAVSETSVPDEVADRAIPAQVPGCVHTDLLAAELIDDPFLDDNETRLTWIGRTDWLYETTFDWTDDGAQRVDLVCDGLDTVAAVSVNGTEVGRTQNMHRGYRFGVKELLRPGDNHVAIRFDSAYRYAESNRDRLGDRPNAYHPEPNNFIRKMPCNFGWDWGPTVVTAGIWRSIGLASWSSARLASVVPQVDVVDGEGRVRVNVELERAADEPVVLVAEIGGRRTEARVAAGEHSASLLVTVPQPRLWWPRGYGDQPLYPLEVSLSTVDGDRLDDWRRRIGFRTVTLDTGLDEHGRAFTVIVNGRPVTVRGVNWIPDDAFVTRVDRDRYAARFAQAAGANVNFLRVWGGGIYESDDFYELADEMGLLVGQDFLFACAAYPEEEPFASEVAAEARYNVARLASHPSLVLWTGNNENIWGWHDWDWQDDLGDDTWGLGFYLDVLPGIMSEVDPSRPYWPSSPYSGSQDRHPNDPAYGSMHIWDVWNTHDYTHYRTYTPRFLAEFGFQAPPVFATLRRSISDEPLAPDSPGMRHHQKAADGDGKLRRGLDAHLPAPRTFDDWHYLTQVNQARAVSLGIEHCRSLHPVCTGTIMWQLNDCWPVTSWSAVDGDGRRKPLWYSMRDSYADRLLTVQPRGDGLVLAVVNDSDTEWLVPVEFVRTGLAGDVRAKASAEVTVPARSAVTVPVPDDVAAGDDPTREVLRADADDLRAWWFFAEDKDIAYPRPRFATEVAAVPGGLSVTVTASTILRDLTLFVDRLDPAAEVDRALVTLLPGEQATFTVTTDAELDDAALTAPPVLRCVNDITA